MRRSWTPSTVDHAFAPPVITGTSSKEALDILFRALVEVARRHEVSRSVLWSWRKQARQGVLVAEPTPMFMPLQVATDLRTPTSRAEAAPVASPRIEIALPDGTVIRVDEAIGAAALRRVVTVLRG